MQPYMTSRREITSLDVVRFANPNCQNPDYQPKTLIINPKPYDLRHHRLHHWWQWQLSPCCKHKAFKAHSVGTAACRHFVAIHKLSRRLLEWFVMDRDKCLLVILD